jgi:hypothetical protein
MAESLEVRGRAAHLEQLTELLDSLGAAEAPPRLVHDVLAQISSSNRQEPVLQFPPRSSTVPKRGVTVNKQIIFGLAAAAAVVLAVITYTTYPPATEGTEATIGAAQRAQQPQIAAKDVGLGDTSAQDVLQTDTWDAIMKDESLRSALQDAELQRALLDADLRESLKNEAVRQALRDVELARYLRDEALISRHALNEAAMRGVSNTRIKAALMNRNFVNALRANKDLASLLSQPGRAQALGGEAMSRLVRDARFAQALARSDQFTRSLAAGRQPLR